MLGESHTLSLCLCLSLSLSLCACAFLSPLTYHGTVRAASFVRRLCQISHVVRYTTTSMSATHNQSTHIQVLMPARNSSANTEPYKTRTHAHTCTCTYTHLHTQPPTHTPPHPHTACAHARHIPRSLAQSRRVDNRSLPPEWGSRSMGNIHQQVRVTV